ncbi:MAG TPA: hypothetical protein VNW73_05180 [Ktedonobacteraceae bacterium]|nr:hypothetical protein [Ktedonobacteraceae bacterium]
MDSSRLLLHPTNPQPSENGVVRDLFTLADIFPGVNRAPHQDGVVMASQVTKN